jgi:hypothetical protein
MSNLLSLPLLLLTVQTGNNEDWIDAIKYVAPPEGMLPEDPTAPQVDLRNILFEMEVRRAPDDHEVVLSATTADGTLSVGAPPDVGFLIFYIQSDGMKAMPAGNYVADVIGRDTQYSRKCIEISLMIVEGVTKWPSPA